MGEQSDSGREIDPEATALSKMKVDHFQRNARYPFLKKDLPLDIATVQHEFLREQLYLVCWQSYPQIVTFPQLFRKIKKLFSH